MGSNTSYTEKNMSQLTPIEAMRFRPTVMIGEIGFHGIMHLVKEVFTNSVDEFIGGHGLDIKVIFKTVDGNTTVTVSDEGRGIPHGFLHKAVAEMNSSGKYGDIDGKGSGGYGVSAGLNGLGLKCCNYLATSFIVTSYRDGKSVTMKYAEGVKVGDTISKAYKGKSGTTISFTPDKSVLGESDLTSRFIEYFQYMEIMSYVNPGIKINFKWEDKKAVTFYHPNGIEDYFNKLTSDRKLRVIGKPYNLKWMSDDKTIGYNITFGFCSNGGAKPISYVNGIHTSDGGVHVQALTEAMGVLTNALNKGNYIPKSMANKFKITGNEISDCMFAVVVADKETPKFDTQIKSKLTSPDYRPITVPLMRNQINLWIENNRSTIDKIGEYTAKLAKVRWENAQNKEKSMKSGSSKNDVFKFVDVKKFTDCNKNDPELCEIFLCEGDSAGSTAKGARNRDYQAVMALRGKVKNVVKSDVLSDELIILIKILGVGYGKDRNINKLRYKRIVILTDADVDGYHISSLLIAFFFRFYPELITNGNIFIAKPPLYTIRTKGKANIYINTHSQLSEVLNIRSLSIFSCIKPDGVPIPKDVAREYMMSLPNYSEMVDGMAGRLLIDPIILECIAVNYKAIMTGDLSSLLNYGFMGTDFNILDGGVRRFNVELGYKHYYIKIDRSFYNEIVVPIVEFIKNNIKLARIRLLGNQTDTIYSGIYYVQGKLIYNSLFNGTGVQITREKGLGSQSIGELLETAMDPETRYIIQLVMTDNVKTAEWITNLFTNSVAKKLMFAADKGAV